MTEQRELVGQNYFMNTETFVQGSLWVRDSVLLCFVVVVVWLIVASFTTITAYLLKIASCFS